MAVSGCISVFVVYLSLLLVQEMNNMVKNDIIKRYLLFNNIIYGNKADIGNQAHLQSGAQPAFFFCVIQGGSTDFAGDGVNHGRYSGTYVSNIDIDPLFDGKTPEKRKSRRLTYCLAAWYEIVQILGLDKIIAMLKLCPEKFTPVGFFRAPFVPSTVSGNTVNAESVNLLEDRGFL